jgi:tyrosyl-tRNA synthetase
LADSLTQYLHGEEGLKEAKMATQAMAIGTHEVNIEGLKASLSTLPTITLEKNKVIGSLYVDLLYSSGLLPSKGEAKRLVQNNGAYLNRVKVEDLFLTIKESDLLEGNLLLLSSGKKKSLVVQIH